MKVAPSEIRAPGRPGRCLQESFLEKVVDLWDKQGLLTNLAQLCSDFGRFVDILAKSLNYEYTTFMPV